MLKFVSGLKFGLDKEGLVLPVMVISARHWPLEIPSSTEHYTLYRLRISNIV